MKTENIREMEEEARRSLKGYVETNKVVFATAIVGTGMYILGRTKGLQLGHIKGRSQGYAEGVKDVTAITKDLVGEIRKSIVERM